MKGRNVQITFREQPELAPELQPELGSRGRWILWGVLLIGLTIAAYSPSITASYIFRDDVNVRENPAVRSWRGLWAIWRYAYDMPQFSPLGYTSFLVEYNTIGWVARRLVD